MNKTLIILTLIVSIGLSQHYAPCDDGNPNHAVNSDAQNCYGYATHRVLGHGADEWCPGNTILRGNVGPWFDFDANTNIESVKASVDVNNLVEWGSHVVQVHSFYTLPPYPKIYVMVNERVGPNKATNTNYDIDLVNTRLENNNQTVIGWHEYTGQTFKTTQYKNNFEAGTIKIENVGTKPHNYQDNVPQYKRRRVEALYQQNYNSIHWKFTHWSTNETNRIILVDTDNNQTVTAYHTGYPSIVNGFQFTGAVGQPISFSWNIHSNSQVTYKIYRKVKNVHGPLLIGTRGHSSTSFTDNDYVRTLTYSDDLVSYDARAYYPPELTEADPYFYTCYGTSESIVQNDNKATIGVMPNEFSLNNYPNPFNPATTIQYSLPERSIINLSIYNLNGKKVREWTIGETSAGVRNITWDGNDHSGNRVPAGVYIYKLDAKAVNSDKVYSDKRKMVFMK